MTQRLGLARMLLHDPQVLLLDEPASGLDPRARIEMRALLHELRAMGKTILVSSHILPELADICNKIGIIERGRLLRAGSLAEIERSLRATALLRIDLLGDEPEVDAVVDRLGTDGRVMTSSGRPQRRAGRRALEVAFDGDPGEQAALLAALVAEGHRVSGFAQVTSDLEELFLQVTGHDEEAA